MRHSTRLKSTVRPTVLPVRISPRFDRLPRGEEDKRLLRRQLFAEMARGEHAANLAIEAILRRLGVNPVPGAALLVQIDTLADFPRDYDEEQAAAIRRSIGKAISEALEGLSNSVVQDISGSRFAIIAGLSPGSNLSEAELRCLLERLCRTVKLSCRQTITVGVGPICFEESHLVNSYHEAQEALSYRVLLGNDRIISCADVRNMAEKPWPAQSSEPYPVQQERKLRERIIAGDKEGARRALDALLESVRGQPGLTPTAFKSYILQMAIIFCRSASRIGADVRELAEQNIQHAEIILGTDSFPALSAFLHDLVEELIDAAVGRGRTPKSDVVVLAKRYIAENYAKSPSLREVANYVHLSPHYFSRLFAKENDCGFQDYLNLVRIEAAKDLLRNSPVKTKQAAGRVGFKDVSHFVRLFRRTEGMTPAKFARSVGQVKG